MKKTSTYAKRITARDRAIVSLNMTVEEKAVLQAAADMHSRSLADFIRVTMLATAREIVGNAAKK